MDAHGLPGDGLAVAPRNRASCSWLRQGHRGSSVHVARDGRVLEALVLAQSGLEGEGARSWGVRPVDFQEGTEHETDFAMKRVIRPFVGIAAVSALVLGVTSSAVGHVLKHTASVISIPNFSTSQL